MQKSFLLALTVSGLAGLFTSNQVLARTDLAVSFERRSELNHLAKWKTILSYSERDNDPHEDDNRFVDPDFVVRMIKET